MDDSGDEVLVLGIGNPLLGDDGFGVRAVEEMERHYVIPDGVRLLDGGTQGLYLVNDVRAARRLLVFDAVDYGLPPGTLKVLRGGDVPRFAGAAKIDMHQTSFQDILSASILLGGRTEDVVVVGVQPAAMDGFGCAISEPVAAALPNAIAVAAEELTGWGFAPSLRTVASEPAAATWAVGA